MPARKINVDGQDWTVTPSGYITQYDQDEFGLFFTKETVIRARCASRATPRRDRGRGRSLLPS